MKWTRLFALARGGRIATWLLAVWKLFRHPDTPAAVRVLAIVVLAYAMSPIDLIPDFIPVLGLLDEALLIPAAVWLFRTMIPRAIYDRHRTTALHAAQRPVSRTGMIVIIALWLTGAILAGWWWLG